MCWKVTGKVRNKFNWAEIIDREEISGLDRIIDEAYIHGSVAANYNAAVAYMLLDCNDKAYSIIERTIDHNKIEVFCHTLPSSFLPVHIRLVQII